MLERAPACSGFCVHVRKLGLQTHRVILGVLGNSFYFGGTIVPKKQLKLCFFARVPSSV